MARVLVLNAGSSSLKWELLESEHESVLDSGNINWSGAHGSGNVEEVQRILRDISDVAAVGHRVVHGGPQFRDPVLIDDAVRDAILELRSIAPLHNPSAVAGIDAARAAFPSVPQVATFDTAFHATITDSAAIYPLPWDWTQRWQLRRYGFHGLSVQYALRRTGELLRRQPRRLIVCHLGAGCSITAVGGGRSVDTSMGFTPLEGLMMVQRSGSVDPGLLLYLLQHMSAEELDRALNEHSGLLGVSGVSSDLREVIAAAESGNERAALAIEMFCHRVRATIGGMAAVLGGLDALVFTGGVGEHSALVRERACAGLDFLGVRLELATNGRAKPDCDVSAAEASVRTLVIAAREELTILADVKRLVAL
ncbi:MAG: acetate/propionate family kinase [Chloroflexi bacterium]|nr:acetate/propionate family kinase [Chloroflexota bacterium]